MSAPVTFIVSKMAYIRVLSCVMLALISSIIINCEHSIESCNNRYTGKLQKKKTKPLKIVIHNYKHFSSRVKRLRCRRESKERRFWTRPGRTSAWWNNFADQVVIPEEWKENFRMSRDSLYNLAEELRL